ncbi:PH domain-containing protein, partial [Blastomonas sp.]|uniref:PH domain-containing protein n=1 Tax=Blastomonas sp. TaxID=1909299 RepID=UPI0035946802
MTASLADMHDIASPAAPFRSLSDGLNPIERRYAHVIRLVTLLFVLPFIIGAGVLEIALSSDDVLPQGSIIAPALAFAAFVLVFLPMRKWRRWGYASADEQLRVARGWLFRTDTIVPFKRIQHIDVAQGPLERLFNLASLTVHTAGTHNSIVTLPGLSPETAAAMRDTMRQ